MTTRLLRIALPLTAALTLGASLAGADAKTPLGQWMQPNMGAARAAKDFATLQKNFEFVASKPPPSGDYPQWSTFAKSGAAAAGKQDINGVKAACNSCHNAYKEKYRKEFPTRAFP